VTRLQEDAFRRQQARLGFGAIALAACGWAIAAIVARRLFDDGVAPADLSAARSVITAVGLGVVLRRATPARGRLARIHIIALGLSIALVNVAYYLAIDRLSVAVAIVLQYTAPALVVGWTAIIRRRPPSVDVLVALVGAVVGVALVVQVIGGEVTTLDGAGVLFGLSSAVLFATYSLLAEPAGRALGALEATARAFLVAGCFWIVVEIFRGWPNELFAADHLVDVMFVSIAGTLLPFLLYVWGIGQVSAERATIAATLEPVFAAAAAWVWLGQGLSVLQSLGGALVLVAIWVLQIKGTIRRATGDGR
jgi:drug/metabolite transporter (DMT)-like permease